MIEELIEQLIEALKENTAAIRGSEAAPEAAAPKGRGRPRKNTVTEAAPTSASTTEAGEPAPEAPTKVTAEEVLKIAQKVLDICSEKKMEGELGGVKRIAAINAKVGFKPSQADQHPQEKVLEMVALLNKELEAVQKAA